MPRSVAKVTNTHTIIYEQLKLVNTSLLYNLQTKLNVKYVQYTHAYTSAYVCFYVTSVQLHLLHQINGEDCKQK